MSRRRARARPVSRRRARARGTSLALAALVSLAGCGDRALQPAAWRFPAGTLVSFARQRGGFGLLRVLGAERVGGGGRLVVHLSVQPDRFPTEEAACAAASAPAPPAPRIAHLPLVERALADPSARLRRCAERPIAAADLDGYRQWRTEYERGRAVIFDRPLAELVAMVEQSPLNQAPPP